MYSGKLVFAQAMDHLPLHTFRRCVQRYNGNQHIKSFTCQDQYRCMGFAQLTYRESLRDIEACLKAQSNKLSHTGIRSTVKAQTWIAVSIYALVAIIKNSIQSVFFYERAVNVDSVLV